MMIAARWRKASTREQCNALYPGSNPGRASTLRRYRGYGSASRRSPGNPMPEIDKYASRAWRQRLREILNRDWDPIGVVRDFSADDEYDGYVGKIAAMLRDNASDEELLTYLKWAEVEHMGLGPARFDRTRILEVITALRRVGPAPKGPGGLPNAG
jgi:hypothetical protein